MMLRQQMTARTTAAVLLIIALGLALLALLVAWQRERSVVLSVKTAELTLDEARRAQGSDIVTLRANLETAKQRLTSLQERVPKDVPPDLFERVAQVAQRSGVTEFRYQRKGEYLETLQAGTYKVYRFAIAARGSEDRLAAFLEGLEKDSSSTMVLENLVLSAADKEWQMTADLIIYTSGG